MQLGWFFIKSNTGAKSLSAPCSLISLLQVEREKEREREKHVEDR